MKAKIWISALLTTFLFQTSYCQTPATPTPPGAKAKKKKKPVVKKTFTFIEYAESAKIVPFPQLKGWNKIILTGNAHAVPYFSLDGDVVGQLQVQEFFTNAVTGLPQPDGSNVKTTFLSFDNYTTATGKTYNSQSAVVEIADSNLDLKQDQASYLIRSKKGIEMVPGTMTGVSLVLSASLDHKAVSGLFVLTPAMNERNIKLNLTALNFSVDEKAGPQ